MTDKNEVIKSVLISEDKAHAIEESILKSQFAMTLAVNNNVMDIALKVTEAVEQKVHVLRGYEDNMKGAEKYLLDTFKIKNTQRKTYSMVTHKFAKRVEGSTEYVLIDSKFRDFGVENLNEIQKLPDFTNTSVEELNAFLDAKGITSETTKAQLQEMRGVEKKDTKKLEDKTEGTTTENKAEGTTTEDNVTTQIKAENDKLHVKVEDTKALTAKLYQVALDKKVNDKEFRKQAIEILAQLEKKYNMQ